MESQAPYTVAFEGPRNLAVPLATWLRTQGFTVLKQVLPVYAAVTAHWVGTGGEHFLLEYAWVAGPVSAATYQLRVLYPGRTFETLFTAQHVSRLREARQLLLGNMRYANARILSRLVPTS